MTLAAWDGAPWLGGLLWILIAAAVLLTLPYPAAAAEMGLAQPSD